METWDEGEGFSTGKREPSTTFTKHATNITDKDAEHTESDSGEHVECNGGRDEENKRNVECDLNQNPARKIRKISKKEPISVVFNYSKVELTQAMNNLLNRGFNFSILPLKLDLTQVLVDFKRFERSMIWHEYFYGTEIEGETRGKIFKSSKTNLPKNYKSPDGLKT